MVKADTTLKSTKLPPITNLSSRERIGILQQIEELQFRRRTVFDHFKRVTIDAKIEALTRQLTEPA